MLLVGVLERLLLGQTQMRIDDGLDKDDVGLVDLYASYIGCKEVMDTHWGIAETVCCEPDESNSEPTRRWRAGKRSGWILMRLAGSNDKWWWQSCNVMGGGDGWKQLDTDNWQWD